MNFPIANPTIKPSIRNFAVIVALFLLTSLNICAQTTTFAQFFEKNGSQDFAFTNNTTSEDFKTIPGGSPVFFIYQNIANLDPSLQGPQNAHLFVTTNTTLAGGVNGNTLTQPLNQTVTLQVIRDTPTAPGVGSGQRVVLLTATFAPSQGLPAITGSTGGDSATIQASTPTHAVQFFSNFVTFGATTDRNLALSFSSVTPSVNLGPGGFLNTSTAAASGTFASNPAPIVAIPTASKISIRGRVLTSDGRGLRNASVTLTDGDGVVRQVMTTSFGNYEFADVSVGQNVVVAVRSKQFRFAARVISLADSVSDLDFVGEN